MGAEQRADLDSTQLTLKLTKLIRATAASEPRDELDDSDGDEYFRSDSFH